MLMPLRICGWKGSSCTASRARSLTFILPPFLIKNTCIDGFMDCLVHFRNEGSSIAQPDDPCTQKATINKLKNAAAACERLLYSRMMREAYNSSRRRHARKLRAVLIRSLQNGSVRVWVNWGPSRSPWPSPQCLPNRLPTKRNDLLGRFSEVRFSNMAQMPQTSPHMGP